jgi:hypothetical protein
MFLTKIADKINTYYFQKDMEFYEKAAWQMKQRVDKYLKENGYEFISGVFPDPEPDWPKVDIRVIIFDKPYSEILKIWEKVSAFAYQILTEKQCHGIFLSLDQDHNKTDIINQELQSKGVSS